MASTFFRITNGTGQEWDECKIALIRQDGSVKPLLVFKQRIGPGEIFCPEIPNATLEDAEEIAYCGLRRNVRIITGENHNIMDLMIRANNLLAG